MPTLGIWRPNRRAGGDDAGGGGTSWTFNLVILPASMAGGRMYYGTPYPSTATVVYVSDFDSEGNDIGTALRANAQPGETFKVTNTEDDRFWWRHEVTSTWEQAPGYLNIYITPLDGGYPVEDACLASLEFEESSGMKKPSKGNPFAKGAKDDEKGGDKKGGFKPFGKKGKKGRK